MNILEDEQIAGKWSSKDRYSYMQGCFEKEDKTCQSFIKQRNGNEDACYSMNKWKLGVGMVFVSEGQTVREF